MNERVRANEQAARLKEICLRLEPKTLGRLKDGRVFRREDVVRDGRTLLHEGDVTWKSSGRQKGGWTSREPLDETWKDTMTSDDRDVIVVLVVTGGVVVASSWSRHSVVTIVVQSL